jgi:hypothetical protein
MSVKNSSDSIGSRTRDLPDSSAVPHLRVCRIFFNRGSFKKDSLARGHNGGFKTQYCDLLKVPRKC